MGGAPRSPYAYAGEHFRYTTSPTAICGKTRSQPSTWSKQDSNPSSSVPPAYRSKAMAVFLTASLGCAPTRISRGRSSRLLNSNVPSARDAVKWTAAVAPCSTLCAVFRGARSTCFMQPPSLAISISPLSSWTDDPTLEVVPEFALKWRCLAGSSTAPCQPGEKDTTAQKNIPYGSVSSCSQPAVIIADSSK